MGGRGYRNRLYHLFSVHRGLRLVFHLQKILPPAMEDSPHRQPGGKDLHYCGSRENDRAALLTGQPGHPPGSRYDIFYQLPVLGGGGRETGAAGCFYPPTIFARFLSDAATPDGAEAFPGGRELKTSEQQSFQCFFHPKIIKNGKSTFGSFS